MIGGSAAVTTAPPWDEVVSAATMPDITEWSIRRVDVTAPGERVFGRKCRREKTKADADELPFSQHGPTP